MKNWKCFIISVCLLTSILVNSYSVNAQENLAQQAYAIFEQSLPQLPRRTRRIY